MRTVVNNVSVKAMRDVKKQAWSDGSVVERPEIEPQIMSENMLPISRSAVNRLEISVQDLFSHDVSGSITLSLVPGEELFVLEGSLQIHEEYLYDIVHRSLETIRDSADGLAEKMQHGQRFVCTVCCGAEQFLQAQAA